MSRRVFVLENSELGSSAPLSVYLTNLLTSLGALKDHEISAIVSESEGIPKAILQGCDRVYQIPGSLYSIGDNLGYAIRAFGYLRKENKRAPIDVLHCLYPNSSLMAAALFKLFSGSKAKVLYDVRSPWIDMAFARGHIRTRLMGILRKILFLSEKLLSRFVDHYVFISEGLRNVYQQSLGIRVNKSSIISTPVNLHAFTPAGSALRNTLNYTDKDVLLGYIGTIDGSRELAELLLIFRELAKGNAYLRLLFIGDGNEREKLEASARHMQLNGSVRFLGKVPHDQVPAYMSSLDFGISHLPSSPLYENSSPLKVLEYLACGIPVLATDIRAHRELAHKLEGITLYHEAADIAPIIKEKNRRGRPEGLDKFSWEQAARRYQEIYNRL